MFNDEHRVENGTDVTAPWRGGRVLVVARQSAGMLDSCRIEFFHDGESSGRIKLLSAFIWMSTSNIGLLPFSDNIYSTTLTSESLMRVISRRPFYVNQEVLDYRYRMGTGY